VGAWTSSIKNPVPPKIGVVLAAGRRKEYLTAELPRANGKRTG